MKTKNRILLPLLVLLVLLAVLMPGMRLRQGEYIDAPVDAPPAETAEKPVEEPLHCMICLEYPDGHTEELEFLAGELFELPKAEDLGLDPEETLFLGWENVNDGNMEELQTFTVVSDGNYRCLTKENPDAAARREVRRMLTEYLGNEPEPGSYLVQGRRYIILPDGRAAVNCEADGFVFGPDGAYTSGDPDLDALLTQTILAAEERAAANRKPFETPRDQLFQVYSYLVYHMQYRKSEMIEPGAQGWSCDRAKDLLEDNYGNCYSFAGAMSELAKALGFHSRVFSGYIEEKQRVHGWPEVEIDGQWLVCDAELAMDGYRFWNEYRDMFLRSYEQLRGWFYTKIDADGQQVRAVTELYALPDELTPNEDKTE